MNQVEKEEEIECFEYFEKNNYKNENMYIFRIDKEKFGFINTDCVACYKEDVKEIKEL